VKGDGKRSIPSAQWKKDACENEERDERKIDSGGEKERSKGRATVHEEVSRETIPRGWKRSEKGAEGEREREQEHHRG